MKEAWETTLVWFFKLSGVLAVLVACFCLLPVCALVVAFGDGKQLEQFSLTVSALGRRFVNRMNTLASTCKKGAEK